MLLLLEPQQADQFRSGDDGFGIAFVEFNADTLCVRFSRKFAFRHEEFRNEHSHVDLPFDDLTWSQNGRDSRDLAMDLVAPLRRNNSLGGAEFQA